MLLARWVADWVWHAADTAMATSDMRLLGFLKSNGWSGPPSIGWYESVTTTIATQEEMQLNKIMLPQ